tara:strand:+ start:12581 stop:15838 length:3258 start_codon:yes stop_codon:yes gene_type:complete
MNKYLLEQLQSRPIPQTETSVYIHLDDSDSDSDPDDSKNTFIIDKRDEFKDTSYDTFINNFKLSHVSKTLSTNIEKPKPKSKSEIKLINKHSTDVANSFIIIGKVDNLLITISSPSEFFSTSSSIPVKVVVDGVLIDTKKLPQYSKKNTFKISDKSTLKYYLNNREIFIQFINSFFNKEKYSETEETEISCDSKEKTDFNLLIHQKIVRDYMNLYTPYRGLLLYHGLGSGKTCSSIAIAEGFKHVKNIMVLTPKSLITNYIEELKNCGDPIYKTNYFWTFHSVFDNKDSKSTIKSNLIEQFTSELSLSDAFIKKKGGAWVPDSTIQPNFNKLTIDEQKQILEQINHMLHSKYTLVPYNGLRKSNVNEKLQTFNGTKNPFDDKVVVVDEAHNFVSTITNKITTKKYDTVPYMLYQWLLSATNCRIIFLTGTPIINTPLEIAVLFNILRGNIHEWTIVLRTKESTTINTDYFQKLFKKKTLSSIPSDTPVTISEVLDDVTYKPSTHTLKFTRNPNGFLNKFTKTSYMGVHFQESAQISNEDLLSDILNVLQKQNFIIKKDNITLNSYTAFVVNDEFTDTFVDIKNRTIKNSNLFKRRIAGLSSFFKSPQEQLMPSYNPDTDFKIVKLYMSKHQLKIYESSRKEERNEEKRNAKKRAKDIYSDVYQDTTSTYRISSRSNCNFVFPDNIHKPIPSDTKGDREVDNDDLVEDYESSDKKYQAMLQYTLNSIKEDAHNLLSPEGLEIYSPKYHAILKHIKNPTHKGLHLLYSDFKTLEGTGIFKLVLLQNGFVEFKIHKNKSNIWILDMEPDDIGKPAFISYTGDEDDTTKEIYRNVYNSLWDKVPITIVEQLTKNASNNFYGDIIKLFMITRAGAEGITLKNCRYVHIMEPYWHPVRMKQVIGRARRICSHQDLYESERNVTVFLYLMTFSDEQIASSISTELQLKDRSSIDNKTLLTTDEYIYEKSNLKDQINNEFINAVKESAIDCNLHRSKNSTDSYTCYSFINPSIDSFLFAPSIKNDELDSIREQNEVIKDMKATMVELDGKKYAMTEDFKVYNYDSFTNAMNIPGQVPVFIGTLDLEKKQLIRS